MAKLAPDFDWNDRLFRFGAYASGGWVACVTFFLWAFADWSNKPKPNEWGDIFAGVAAPIAFLWLVLGFLQQGRELRLQVEELRNTVKHQADLAAATREQVALQVRQEERDRQQAQIAAQPRFVLSNAGTSGGPQGVEYTIKVTNGGAIATNVHVSVEPKPYSGGKHFAPSISAIDGTTFNARYLNAPTNDMTVLIRFTDAMGVDGQQQFTGIFDPHGLRFVRLAE